MLQRLAAVIALCAAGSQAWQGNVVATYERALQGGCTPSTDSKIRLLSGISGEWDGTRAIEDGGGCQGKDSFYPYAAGYLDDDNVGLKCEFFSQAECGGSALAFKPIREQCADDDALYAGVNGDTQLHSFKCKKP
ncbi:hypothetical protein JX265_009612 [Neoarthrinium moseri]|uniref:Uncharacterized protein n=1 Tax=Neoarthrinium moseri TaxID=1658444 RepID=A0A9Q0AL97_9PEZI|nr:hypothetical protein JX265_009612 [Neoarthrinium moseri]